MGDRRFNALGLMISSSNAKRQSRWISQAMVFSCVLINRGSMHLGTVWSGARLNEMMYSMERGILVNYE